MASILTHDNLILASASPRRQELLRLAGLDFVVSPAKRKELLPNGIPPEEAPLYLAAQKAGDVAVDYPEAMVIGCDTVVILDGILMGKPDDEADAVRMLRRLSGKRHDVLTGVCIRRQTEQHSFCEKTEVEFYSLTEREIEEYVATGEPLDKAGAYGIQGRGGLLVKAIRGDFYNVVGLPVSRLCRVLRNLAEGGR